MTKYQIDITSDVVCPWCYIGHTRLTRAMAAHKRTHPDDSFHLTYHPYYLEPPPAETLRAASFFPAEPASRPRIEVYGSKFGGEANARSIFARLGAAAKQDGLEFKFGGRTGPSRNGHRLVRYAQSHGGEDAQNRTMLGLWRRYYEAETDITELSELVAVGVEAGLGREDEIRDYLLAQGDQREAALRDVRDIDRETQHASLRRGIRGVPNYDIGADGLENTYEVSGAQEPVLFEKVFEELKRLEASAKKHTQLTGAGERGKAQLDGEACGIDGKGQC